MSSKMKRDLVDELILEVRASQAAVDEMDEAACRELGINRTDGRCLDIVQRAGQMTAGTLAQRSGLTTAAVTTVLDRMENAGYVRRVRDVQDRRCVLVELTPLAHDRAEQIWGPFQRFREELVTYTNEQLETLLAFHRRAREYNQRRAAEVRATTAQRAELDGAIGD